MKSAIEEFKDGATLDPVTLQRVAFPAGYQVGITNNVVTPDNLAAALADVAEKARQFRGGFVGVWYDGANWFIDVSVLIRDAGKAMAMAALLDQQAVWGWAEQDCLYLEAAKVA